MKKLLALLVVPFMIYGAYAITVPFTITVGGSSGDLPFSMPTGDVVHYIAATGCSDANNGTSPATPWCTPNHALHCGDVIIAAPGTYGPGTVHNPFVGTFQTPTNCPSTTGGIDGAGGVFYAILLCGNATGTADLGSNPATACVINGSGDQNGGFSVEFAHTQSNWAVSGFYFDTQCVNTGTPGNCSRSFGETVNAGTDAVHHLALINSVVVNSMQAMGGRDCGNASCIGNLQFGDYKAAVGVIAYNASLNGDYQGCCQVAAIDFTNLGNWDANAGTHNIAYNNYVINSACASCNNDSEAFMTDSPDIHGFAHTMVYVNNIAYNSRRSCIQATYNGAGNNPSLSWYMYNNTCFGNNINVSPASGGGEFDTGGNGSSANFSFKFYNNIMMPATATSAGGSIPIYAAVVGGETWASWLEGTAVNASGKNVLFGFQGACGSGCAPPGGAFTAETYFNGNPVATATQNFYVNPAFQNTSDLLSNHATTAPNCSGFINTTACMGWNANSHVLTTNSVIYDLQATCANCAGKGFQQSSTTCITLGTANTVVADYPTWLKAVVYLHWTGSSIVRKADMATLPCGM